MKEEFLHYLWKHQLYYTENLLDAGGNKITIINPGEYNRDSGPDFFNARILIDGILWAGNIEMHIRSSHFISHGHHEDPSYDNVILHVVDEIDRKVFNSKGEEIITVKISFDPGLYERYLDLVNNPMTIACQDDLGLADNILVRHWLNSLVIERLQKKSELIMKIFYETGNDWDETFYRLLSRYFGFRVNCEPFEMLSAAIPFRIIRKHADNRFQIEALLFGTAGLLDEGLFRDAGKDDYYLALLKEYRVLSSKYSLNPIHGWLWKFSRLRPVNFPTIRISQLSALLSVTGGLFSKVLEMNDLSMLKEILEVDASDYWRDHYVFGKKSRTTTRRTGRQAALVFLINAIIPVIFVYGRERDQMEISERAIEFLEELDAEENIITSEWRSAGIDADSAFYSQALIQLRNEYCKRRRCLECRIGSNLISMGRKLRDQKELLLEP
jgi:hypothetical protein